MGFPRVEEQLMVFTYTNSNNTRGEPAPMGGGHPRVRVGWHPWVLGPVGGVVHRWVWHPWVLGPVGGVTWLRWCPLMVTAPIGGVHQQQPLW